MFEWPFVVLSLPRSRTAWLQRWLSGGEGAFVGHDLAIEADSCQGFLDLLWHGLAGTIETGAAEAWLLLQKAMPGGRMVVVRRDLGDVLGSLEKMGVEISAEIEKQLVLRDAALDAAEIAGATRIEFDDLSDVNCCAWLWEFLRQTPFQFDWWQRFADERVEIDWPQRQTRLAERASALAGLKADLVACLTGNPEFVRVGWEPLRSCWEEAQALAAEHQTEVGKRPGFPALVDWQMLARAESVGSLAVTTARSNGRLVGYLTWSLVPDPEAGGMLVAEQGAWFVLPRTKLLGRRMLEWGLRALQRRGFQHFHLHHQIEGRGARLGLLFERLGAVEFQRKYSLYLPTSSGQVSLSATATAPAAVPAFEPAEKAA